uniref:PIN domain-containing protein n=1 Tax=uncultured bacterium esnapd15 TaxID=1366595 RepID=S5TN21_9BACT|nr:hypothetical protein [uncultured bacterium esnapd15]
MVVDTSVFIHHPDKIRDIPYAEVAGLGAVPVRLVVPRVVVDELDRLKEAGNQQVRWRAGHTLGVLDELLTAPRSQVTIHEADPNWSTYLAGETTPVGKVTIEVFFDDPHHVRLPDADDEIIDRATVLQAYAGQPATLLTMDSSMAFRARLLGLPVRKPAREIGDEPAKPQPKPTRRSTATAP